MDSEYSWRRDVRRDGDEEDEHDANKGGGLYRIDRDKVGRPGTSFIV
jgi:hypothetical protein